MARPRRPLLGLLPALLLPLLLLLPPPPAARGQEEAPSPDWRDTLRTIRNGVHKIDTYLNAALDLLGGEDGLCRFQCADGERGRGGRRPEGPDLPLFSFPFPSLPLSSLPLSSLVFPCLVFPCLPFRPAGKDDLAAIHLSSIYLFHLFIYLSI